MPASPQPVSAIPSDVDATPVASKPPRSVATDEDFRAGLIRLSNAYANRISNSGVSALADAVAVRAALDLVIDAGVERCLMDWQASWAEIAEATGLTRQGAMRRWGGFDSARQRGGQPSNLR